MATRTKAKSPKTKKPIERAWYPLDGSWHKSVATKLSALHLSHPDYARQGARGEILSALCDPMGKVLYENDPHTDEEARDSGRTVCARCTRIAGAS